MKSTRKIWVIVSEKNSSISSTIIIFLLIFPFFAPAYIGLAYPSINNFINYWELISLMMVIMLFKSIPRSAIYISYAYCPIIFSTILNGADIKTAMFQYAYVIGIAMIMEYSVRVYGKKESSKAFMLLFEGLIYTNLFSIIIHPNGLYHSSYLGIQLGELTNNSGLDRVGWLLGHQSLCSSYSIAAISIATFYSYHRCGEIKIVKRSQLLIIASVAQAFLSKSGMNALAMIVLFALILSLNIGVKKILENYKVIFILGVIVTFIVTYSNILNLIAPWIESTFNRSADLSGRIPIWRYAISLFLKHPIFGYGLEFEDSSMLSAINNVSHAHNQYIQVLYSGGVVGFVGIVLFIWNFFKNSKLYIRVKVLRVNVLCCYIILLLMLTDVYFFRHSIVVVPFIVCYLICQVNGKQKEEVLF